MKKLHTVRILLLALLVSLVPAVSHAGVFISVGFAPPPLPVYVQPMCPEPGLMWVPGYWAYGPDGYYWVPGAWVPAPYEGALWTPGYWGWGDGFYMWHPGYWGNYVGYYGGVNYGFGYFGIGFVGGHWHDHDFPAARSIPQQKLARILELRRDIEQLEADLKSAEQEVRGQLEAGAAVESGLFRAYLKTTERRSVAWKAVVERECGADYAARVLAATKPDTTTHLVVTA